MSNCYIPQIHLFLYLWFGFIVLVSLPSIIHIVVHRILFFYALHIFMNKSYVLGISLWVIYGLFLYMFLHIFYFIYHFLLLSWDLDARKISQNSINQNVSKTHRGILLWWWRKNLIETCNSLNELYKNIIKEITEKQVLNWR